MEPYMNCEHDEYGDYEMQVRETFDGVEYEWRRYFGSPEVRKRGRYANVKLNSMCEVERIKFYTSRYVRDHDFPKFMHA